MVVEDQGGVRVVLLHMLPHPFPSLMNWNMEVAAAQSDHKDKDSAPGTVGNYMEGNCILNNHTEQSTHLAACAINRGETKFVCFRPLSVGCLCDSSLLPNAPPPFSCLSAFPDRLHSALGTSEQPQEQRRAPEAELSRHGNGLHHIHLIPLCSPVRPAYNLGRVLNGVK